MGKKTKLAAFLTALSVLGTILLALGWTGATAYFAYWFWQRSHDFGIQHQIEDRKYGLLGFATCVIEVTSFLWAPILVILILWLRSCGCFPCLVRRARSNKEETRTSKGRAVCVDAVKDAIRLITLSGFVAIKSLLLARLIKWLPHFKARGESSNVAGCIGSMFLLSFELALLCAPLLVAILLFAIRMCILVIFVCSRKKQWTWNEYDDSFKHYSKIYKENLNCFEQFKEWCGRQRWGKALVRREENSSTTSETDLQGV
ncbi:hypothetical protein HDV62DRAFT_135619 [Trichoderma sp. SZMC 28011]